MFKKLKNIILKTDSFLYKKFGTDKSTKALENIKEARILFAYLNEPGQEDRVRFVGGCVRFRKSQVVMLVSYTNLYVKSFRLKLGVIPPSGSI